MKRAVELAFTVATPWELSCRRASLPFSPGTQVLEQELKTSPCVFWMKRLLKNLKNVMW